MTRRDPAALIRGPAAALTCRTIAKTHPGQVAQLVEQGTENPRVGGSIPSLATIRINCLSHISRMRCVIGYTRGVHFVLSERTYPRVIESAPDMGVRDPASDMIFVNGFDP